jgi:hypothetical protein
MRALSLVDIALWDVKGKRAGMPVWSLLRRRARVGGVAIVGGYPRADLRPEEVGERVAAYSRDGYDVVKIARAPDNRGHAPHPADGAATGLRSGRAAGWSTPRGCTARPRRRCARWPSGATCRSPGWRTPCRGERRGLRAARPGRAGADRYGDEITTST